MRGKRTRRPILCFLLVMIMLFGVLPKPVMAAAPEKYVEVGTLAPDVSIKPKVSSYDSNTGITTNYCYRITIPSDGFIKIGSSAMHRDVYLLPALSKCQNKYISAACLVAKDFAYSKYTFIPILKGTYYICSPDDNYKVRYTFRKCAPADNYCMAKAKPLAANKNLYYCFPKGYAYNRWYKITLTSKQPITVISKTLPVEANSDFTIFNSVGRQIACPHVEGFTFRTAKQKAGTYYIRLNTPPEAYQHPAITSVRTISWS